MKVILFGLGSIGRRHARNLRALAHHVIAADPHAAPPEPDGTVSLFYRDWRRALADHADAGGCVIASPTAHHLEQIMEVSHAEIPCYVEKPLLTAADYRQLAVEHLLPTLPLYGRHAVGFQYAFHPRMPSVERLARKYGELSFSGQDDLLARYGPDVEGIMVAHPCATAIRLLGAVAEVCLLSDGVHLSGHITHAHGVSRYDFRLDRGPRESWAGAGGNSVALPPDDGMYRDCLSAFLTLAASGQRDARLADLSLGVQVSAALAEVRRWESV